MMELLDITVRRQLLYDDQHIVGQAFALSGENARAVQANTRHMALMLLDSKVKDRASRMAAFAEKLVDANVEHHLKESVACRRGCSHCCTTYVSASIPEIFRLAEAVRGKSMTHARVIAAAARAKAMPQLQREIDRVICPILDNHACSEYLARPVVCRAVLSTSLGTCERIFLKGANEPFTAPLSLGALRSFMIIMMRAALKLASLPYRNLELTHGLQVALADKESEERWLAGEPVFADVAIDRLDQESSPLNKLVDGLAGAVQPTI
jgi:Fe-S-cluster containining protein